MRSLLLLLAAIGTVIAAGSLGPGRALAHAQLLEVTPANDELLDEAPIEVVLRFSEAVSLTGGSARVLDDAAQLVSAEPVLRGDTITVPLTGALHDGTYTVTYAIVSADSHRIAGASVFHVGVRTSTDAVAIEAPATDIAWGVRLGGAVFTGLAYAGMLVAGGIAALSMYGDRSRPWWRRPEGGDELSRRWDAMTVRAAVLGAVAILAATPFRIARVGGGLDALRDNDLLRDAMRGPIGQSMAVVVIALFAVAVAVDQRAPGAVVAAFVALTAVGFTLEGHTRADRRWAMTMFDVGHQVAGAVWLGGLVALVISFRAGASPGRLAVLVRRFSTAALAAVVMLAAAGVLMAWVILPGWGELTGTGWGLALLVKVGVVAVVVVIGAYNNRRLVQPSEGEWNARTTRRLALTVTSETVLLLLVVAITSVLVTRSPIGSAAPPPAPTVPPGVTTTVPGERQVLVITMTDGGTAELIVSPARAGRNEVEVVLWDEEGRIVNPVEPPLLSFREPRLDVGPLEPALSPRYIGDYEAAVDLPFAGSWEVSLRVRVSDFESVAGSTTLDIGES